MAPKVTMAELVETVSEFARTEEEIVAAVSHMVNAGLVELVGAFRGGRIVFDDAPAIAA